MTDIPTPNPVRGGKNVLGKFKGLPPWAYLAAFGVGGVVIYWTISKSHANAATAAQDTTGTDTGTEYATTAGDPYPNGGGAGVSTIGSDTTSNDQNAWDTIQHLIDSGILPTGGGTQPDNSPANNYTPPSIIVNIPPAATPTPPTVPSPSSSSAPASHPWGNGPDPCTGEYPFYQDSGSRKGKCYKVVKKSGKDYRYYKGENLPIPV